MGESWGGTSFVFWCVVCENVYVSGFYTVPCNAMLCFAMLRFAMRCYGALRNTTMW